MAGIHALHGIAAIRHARCQKLFLFPQSVAKQKKKAELFCKERLRKDISQSKQILLKMCTKSPSQLRSLDRYCDGTFGCK